MKAQCLVVVFATATAIKVQPGANASAALVRTPCDGAYTCPSGLVCDVGHICTTVNRAGFAENTARFQNYCMPYYNNHDGSSLDQCFDYCEADTTCVAFYYSGGKGRGGATHCGFCRSGFSFFGHGGHDYHFFEKVATSTPTPAPTSTVPVAGAAGGASATGDPHLQNVLGQRFDLMKPGNHVLINIPRGRHKNAMFRVQADARQLGGQCADMYFQELNITGEWVEAKVTGGLRFQAQGVHDEQPNWLKFGKVQVKVAHGHTQDGAKYLNFYVKHLGHSGFAVGGLLGEDDHAEAARPSEACAHHNTLLQLSSETGRIASDSSVAEASYVGE
jgi:hypothetical protein